MKRGLVFGMLVVTLGCGSGDAGPGTGGISGGLGGAGAGGISGAGGGGGAGACALVGGRLLSWVENGVRQCAILSVTATHAVTASVELLQIGGGVINGSFAFAITAMPPISGVFTCGSSPTGFPSVIMNYDGATPTDCTINVTDPGTPGVTNASGVFSATFADVNGVPTVITDGVFNSPVTGQ